MATQQQHMVETIHKKAMIMLLMAISPELNCFLDLVNEKKKEGKNCSREACWKELF